MDHTVNLWIRSAAAALVAIGAMPQADLDPLPMSQLIAVEMTRLDARGSCTVALETGIGTERRKA